ncbi:MAG: SpoIIE family protein phosphatase [Planctomycetota bacterium]
MTLSLILRGQDREERRLDFDKPKVTIGANPLCDVHIERGQVAAEQAILVQRGGRMELFDIGHEAAILVNGRPFRHGEVRPGDEIWIGESVLVPIADSAVSFVDRGEGRVHATVSSSVEALAAKPAESVPVREGPELRRLLDEVVRLMNSIGRNENIFESILDTVFSSAPVLRAFLALRDSSGGLVVKAHRNRETANPNEAIEVSQTLVGKVLESGEALLTSDAEGDPDLSLALSIQRLRIKAAICVPLVVEGKVIGLLYGDNRERPGILTAENLAFLSALAGVAAVAVEKLRLLEEYEAKRKIEQALRIARSIHQNFLPSAPPEVEGFDVSGRSVSCDATGGDYFDYFRLDDDHLGVVIADVAGHGIGPALLMASMRASLRALVMHGTPLDDLLYRLNDLIHNDVQDGRFITLFFAVLNRRERRFRHIGAGHTPPIWFRSADGSLKQIHSGGPPLGILNGIHYHVGEVYVYEPGDVFQFTTDGIPEAVDPSGRQFGMARLEAALAREAPGRADGIIEAVYAELGRFVQGAPQQDDTTLVAVKIA